MVYYQLDHLGTPIAAHNAKGEAVWTAEYEAWGRIRQETVSDGLKVNVPFRFQGQYYDKESGLHYNRFRYYDPEIGRFVSQDPIGLKGGGNLYAYVVTPTLWIDPLGLDHRSVFWSAVKHDTHRDKYQVHHIFPRELFEGERNNLRASQILKCHNIAKDGIRNLIGLPKNENDKRIEIRANKGLALKSNSYKFCTNCVKYRAIIIQLRVLFLRISNNYFDFIL